MYDKTGIYVKIILNGIEFRNQYRRCKWLLSESPSISLFCNGKKITQLHDYNRVPAILCYHMYEPELFGLFRTVYQSVVEIQAIHLVLYVRNNTPNPLILTTWHEIFLSGAKK